MKILIVLTSHDKLGDTGKKTGFWLEELAAPYYVFKDAGAELTLASVKGGQPPLDPKSNEPEFQTDLTRRFEKDTEATNTLANTHKLSTMSMDDFDAVFYPGGHGPMWDLAEDKDSAALIERAIATDKLVTAVCHAPCVFKNVKGKDGKPFVAGRSVTGFANSEEEAVQLTKVVPFLVEDMLKEKGGKYSKGPDWAPYVLVDGLLVTGQNPASSGPAAKELLKLFKN
ncbi:type 1 glutamine amidotransferase domain-containing protein [Paraburkholderia edwinii]|jgi:putative intracellular protease/amidase|uniref:Type 1 glutamine amidotransferase domain-containing protein n=1 Tax=Paraburkholderia edwinii TaxID=2861782 RepID=A0ABX8URW7_9BURK|nr:type 1 glutamine amidotransferase domain-containing protein [Paraburkholderia edwinii]QYD71744.1 type 1 glutamine amidotransferase domain-containing protein [Paraburkholderia edwinii]